MVEERRGEGLRLLLVLRSTGGVVTSTSLSRSVFAKSLPRVLSPKPLEEKSIQSLGDDGDVGDVGDVTVRLVVPFVDALTLPFV